ncbi:MAG: hypothetical protein ABSH20_05205 [Tepidisphaeraceae bacterium]
MPDEFRHGPMAEKVVMLPRMGILCAALGLLLILVRLTKGPGRDIILEARRGSLHADRSIAGDRVAGTYSADEVQRIPAEGGQLCLHTKMGPTQSASLGPGKAMPALAMLLASRLWYPKKTVVRQGKVRDMGGSVEQQWFVPTD